MKPKILFVIALGCIFAGVSAQAATITQVFTTGWWAQVQNRNGDVAAMKWRYLPYATWDSSLGTLREVMIQTVVSGTRDSASDAVSIEYGFFTGWSPSDWQLNEVVSLAGGSQDFVGTWSHTYSGESALQNWLHYDYLPSAHYYIESRTVEAAHTMSATTTLIYRYTTAVPEPGTLALLGLGLAGLGLSRRRRAN